jgi:LPS export ABC transporter protein LptC
MPLFNKRAAFYLQVLLILLFISILALFFTNYQNSSQQVIVEANAQTYQEQEQVSVALGLEVHGVDHHNREFTIVAAKGMHQDHSIEMDELYIQMYLYGTKQTKIYAKHGIASFNQKTIMLDKEVKIELPEGDIIRAQEILVDYKQGVVSSNRPISINLGRNHITANRFRMLYTKDKKTTTFDGNAKARIAFTK